jgi:imidazoleglycerol phosphate synthase glutamine amidotransferase subunit HisH
VEWSNTGAVSKKLRHVNIREFRVREAQRFKEIDIIFIPGKSNPADLMTKEHKSTQEYTSMRDIVVCRRPDGGCQESIGSSNDQSHSLVNE